LSRRRQGRIDGKTDREPESQMSMQGSHDSLTNVSAWCNAKASEICFVERNLQRAGPFLVLLAVEIKAVDLW